MVTLRDYQIKVKQQILAALAEGKKRLLIVMPTGAGKTSCFADFIATTLAEGKHSLVVAHRTELITQPADRLRLFGVSPGIVMAASNQQHQQVLVASIQTLARRKLYVVPDYLIIDECHRSLGPTYQKLIDFCADSVLLGFTATPVRTDNKFLGKTYQQLIAGPSIAELTDWGYLVPAVCYGPSEPDLSEVPTKLGDFDQGALYSLFDKQTLYSGTVKFWKQYAEGRQTIAFCQSVEHSKKVCQSFQDAGIKAVHLDGETPDAQRKQYLADLASGEVTVLCNYGIAVEGIDIPAVSAIILDMATLSLSKFLQAIGRGLRPAEEKDNAIILDFGGNVKRHGFPSAERDWQLEGKAKKPGICPVKECKNCYLLVNMSIMVCPDCGYHWPVKVVQPVEAEFTILVPAELNIDPALMSISQLAEAAKYNGGMKWVLKQLRIRCGQDLKAQLEGMKFASGAEYAATKQQLGKGLYLAYLQAYGAVKNYSELWAKQQVKYY